MILQKISNTQKDKDLQNILLAIGLIMGFMFITSLTIYFIKIKYGLSCSCQFSLFIIIVILVSLGVLVGITTYYFLSKSLFKEKEKIHLNIEKTLNFLDADEKTIFSELIKNKGEIAQNSLGKIVKIDSVKLHRRLLNLELKNIIHKKKSGMTNIIVLNDEFKDLFIK